jgi:hypothetical protein
MEIKLGQVDALSLAFGFFPDEEKGRAAVRQLALANNKNEAQIKTFYATIVVTQHGVRTVTYIQYMEIGATEILPNGLRKTALPAGPAVEMTLSEAEYATFEDGAQKDALENFLKSHQVRIDMRNVLFLAHKVDGLINVKIPVKNA